jgi:hypothetical protein
MKELRQHPPEAEMLDRIATRFQERGYTVVKQPSGAQLPSFLQSVRPDLLASNETESVVVEVRSRDSIVGSKEVSDIARIVDGREGWRFQLVYVGGKQHPSTQLKSASRQVLGKRLRTARAAIRGSDSDSAILLLWSIVEPLLREQALRLDLPLDHQSSKDLVRQCYMSGLIGWKEYRLLQKSAQARNRIAHGFAADARSRATAQALANFAEDWLGRR